MKLKIYTATEVRELRRKSGLSQHEFWQCLRVTQSCGSRYELRRKMPAPMQLLLNVAFGTEAQSTACVDALCALAKPPRNARNGGRTTISTEPIKPGIQPPHSPERPGFNPESVFTMTLKIYTGTEVRELRRKGGLNQFKFWKTLHVTHSGASRYESGYKIPAPLQLLLNITFGTQAKSAACVDALRALAKPPKRTKAPKVPAAFGMLP